MRRLSFTVVLACALSGCARPEYDEAFVVAGAPEEPLAYNRARLTYSRQGADRKRNGDDSKPCADGEYCFAREWAWNREGNRTNPPNLCLAFSGGGMRAGTFSVGVLRGLAKQGLLDRVEMISAVSGGSYAAAAFFAQHIHLHKHEGRRPAAEAVLGNRFLKHLQDNGKLFERGTFLTPFLGTLSAAAPNIIENGFWAWHSNTVSIAETYREKVRRAFLADPWSQGPPSQADLDLPLVGSYAYRNNLPFLVINGTARYEESGNRDGISLAQDSFDFSFLGYGSDGLGRFPYCATREEGVSPEPRFVRKGCHIRLRDSYLDDDRYGHLAPFPGIDFAASPSLSLAVATSGAAIDFIEVSKAAPLGQPVRKLLSAANVDWGRMYQNPSPEISQDSRLAYNVRTFPLYYGDWNTFGKKGVMLYVTDGGHSENLGLHSLVRRGCQNIVVADGEHDPEYVFGAYRSLKQALRDELGVTFEVPEIDRQLALEDRQSQGEDRIDYLERESARKGRAEGRAASFGRKPVMEGSIRWLPFADSDGRLLNDGTIRVAYIKLSKEPNPGCRAKLRKKEIELSIEREPTSQDEERYYCHTVDEPWALIGGGIFPQESTADVTYQPLQVRAYVHLGERIVREAGGQLASILRQPAPRQFKSP